MGHQCYIEANVLVRLVTANSEQYGLAASAPPSPSASSVLKSKLVSEPQPKHLEIIVTTIQPCAVRVSNKQVIDVLLCVDYALNI